MSSLPGDGGLAEVCARHGLSVIARLEVPGGASHFAAKVQDNAGHVRFLKRGSGLRGNGEIPTLQAYARTGHVPGALEPLDEATFLCEWIEGATLDRSTRDVAGLLRRCGQALRDMHAAPLPAFPFMTIRRRAGDDWFECDMGSFLPEEMHAPARSAAEDLRLYDDTDAVLLHGDCVPWNILVNAGRVVFLDPIGFVGPPAWDVAQLAIALPRRDRRRNLEDIVAGYGTPPALLASAFAYLAFMFLAKNLEIEAQVPGSRGHFIADLGQLCETLIGN